MNRFPLLATGPIVLDAAKCPCGSRLLLDAVKTWTGIVSGRCGGCDEPVTIRPLDAAVPNPTADM